jgi:CTP:molybdopterin cytidylyltransferase MocA
MTVPILLLAAGASSRMAPLDKLAQTIAGEPLLRRSARIARDSGAPVIVVLPPGRPDRAALLAGLDVATVIAADAAQGMSASLRAGIAALPPGVAGAMILPADMPGLAARDLRRLQARFAADPTRILRATAADGTPGHPILFPADLLPDLQAVTGDQGGRAVLRAQAGRVANLALPGDRATLDLDTPADWAAFRAAGNPA